MSLILVVEQEARYVERIHDALSSEGWQVRVANDRASAEKVAAQERPTLVLVSSEIQNARDILGGYSRKRGGPGALVLVTEGSQDTLTAANFQADDLLAKPFTDSDLRLLVRRMLNAAQRQAAEAHAASTKRFTSQELFSDMLAEVESAPAEAPPPPPSPRPAADVQKKLEQTLSGLLDKPAARASKSAMAGQGAKDVDAMLSKSLSGLELPKSKPAAAPPPKPAAAPETKPEPPKSPPVEAVKSAPPPPVAPVPVAPLPPPPLAVVPPPPAAKPAAAASSADRSSKAMRAPEDLLKQVVAKKAEKPKTATGEFKRRELDFSKLDELVKPATKTPSSKSGAGRVDDAFRTQRIETVRPAIPEGPREFGQYTLLRRIATGGMAEVWQARMKGVEGFQKTVAIKKILPHLTDSVDFVTMFIDEAKLAAQLNHPNIIHIYDLGKLEDDYYIAMEYVEGKDLRSILNQARSSQRPLPLGLALLVAARLAAALDYAHRKKDFEGRELGLVHRDVSPQNVLIGYEGDIKLCDFGIVKAVSKASKTQMGALKGKLQYMSPEQAWGKTVDARSDIFSLGALLFEMLTGRRLFAGDSEISILDAVREGKLDRPRNIDPAIPREVDELVAHALARDPDDRFQTAGQMQRELEKVLAGLKPQPVQADLAAYMHLLFGAEARVEERSVLAAAVAAAPAPAMVPAAAEAASKPGREVAAIPPRDGAPAEAGEGKGRGLLIAAILAAVVIGAAVYYFFGRGKSAEPPPAIEAPQTAPAPEGANGSAAGGLPPAAQPPQESTAPASTAPASGVSPAASSPSAPAKPAAEPLKAATATPPAAAPPSPATSAVKPAAPPATPATTIPPPPPAAAANPEPAPPPAQEPAAAPPEPVQQAAPAPTPQAAPEPPPPAPEPAPAAPAAPAVQVGDLVTPGPGVVPPSLLNRPSPAYPPMAKMQRVEGTVSVEVLVDENGVVRDTRFVKKVAQNVGLNESAMSAAQQAKFRPATKGGVRVKMWYTLTFPFKL
jgi:TonB family protein